MLCIKFFNFIPLPFHNGEKSDTGQTSLLVRFNLSAGNMKREEIGQLGQHRNFTATFSQKDYFFQIPCAAFLKIY